MNKTKTNIVSYSEYYLTFGRVHLNVNQKTAKMPKWDSFWQVIVPLSILLLAAIGAKLIGPHGNLQVGKWTVYDEQAPWNDPYVAYMTKWSNNV